MVAFIFVKQIKFMFYGIHGARCAINEMFQYSTNIQLLEIVFKTNKISSSTLNVTIHMHRMVTFVYGLQL